MAGDLIDIGGWCSQCHRRVSDPSPHARPGSDEFLSLDRETGRWHHMLCRLAARHREEGGTTVDR
ncbi:MAG TPA: hypothetical protein VFJ85_02230 [Acidimicrobiales bacterium]|nr:hypothetical protein [Acidimicrobiales bacterium]